MMERWIIIAVIMIATINVLRNLVWFYKYFAKELGWSKKRKRRNWLCRIGIHTKGYWGGPFYRDPVCSHCKRDVLFFFFEEKE